MQNPTFLLLLCEKEQKTQFSKLEMSIQLSVFKNAKNEFLDFPNKMLTLRGVFC